MPVPFSIAGTVPGEAVNGLFTIVPDLLTEPAKLRLIVGLVDVDTIKHKIATGEDTPVVQLRHIEVTTAEGKHGEALAEILNSLMCERTGQEQMPLPFTPGGVAPPPPAKGPRDAPPNMED